MPGPTKLYIAPCDLNNESITELKSPPPFSVMMNPDGYTIKSSLQYDSKQPRGRPSQAVKFKGADVDSISIKPLILDGTGVVPGAPTTSVTDQIAALRAVVAEFDGKQHECRIVKLVWGSFIHFARLKSMNVEYTLFSSNGIPLRAKVTMDFVAFKTEKESLALAKLSSPDLTHRIETQAGDTLALLCHRIYKSQAYVQDVARANGMDSTRILPPGTTLFFPPLKG